MGIDPVFQSRWDDLAPGGAATAWDALFCCYADPRRAYHTLHHVRSVLWWVRRAPKGEWAPGHVEIAGWFHDAVYQPGAATNESDSARLAAGLLRAGGASEADTRLVSQLIVATDHRTPPATPAAARLCDADLAILGAPPNKYRAYTRAIRREYAAVGDADFRRGRLRFVEQMLARPVFASRWFRRRLEAKARANLHAELGTLCRRD